MWIRCQLALGRLGHRKQCSALSSLAYIWTGRIVQIKHGAQIKKNRNLEIKILWSGRLWRLCPNLMNLSRLWKPPKTGFNWNKILSGTNHIWAAALIQILKNYKRFNQIIVKFLSLLFLLGVLIVLPEISVKMSSCNSHTLQYKITIQCDSKYWLIDGAEISLVVIVLLCNSYIY